MGRMLFPRHPKPVVDPRPVATHSIRQEARSLPGLTLNGAFEPKLAAPVLDAPIRFTARYRMREYLQLVQAHLLVVLRERGKPIDRLGPGSRLMLALVLGPMFLYKKWRVGDCRFELTAEGLTRSSKGRPFSLAWRDATAIHRYHDAYLVATERGALPLPHRCFSDTECARLERWLDAAHPSTSP